MSEGRCGATESPDPAAPRKLAALLGLLGLLALASVLLTLSGDGLRYAARYERLPVLEQGEYWRLLSGHFVHGSATHLVLNLSGLALIAALFPREYSLRQWLIILAASMIAIDLGFVLFEPQLEWYVGLSGVLHGALAAGAVAWWQQESRLLAATLSSVLIGKLGWEQWRGALPLSGDMAVIVDAHLYGAIGGLIAAGGICLYLQRWRDRP